MCPPMWAHWCHLTNITELVLPLAHPSPQPKWQIDQFSHFCAAHVRKSLYFAMGDPFLKIAPSHGDLESHLTHDSLAHPSHNQNGISISSPVFAQMTAECPYTLQCDAPFLPQNCPSHGGFRPHLTHGSMAHLSAQPK